MILECWYAGPELSVGPTLSHTETPPNGRLLKLAVVAYLDAIADDYRCSGKPRYNCGMVMVCVHAETEPVHEYGVPELLRRTAVVQQS